MGKVVDYKEMLDPPEPDSRPFPDDQPDMKPGMIFQKIIAVMRECPPIDKTQKNAQQNFMFRGIDTVMIVLNPLFRKHGVFAVPIYKNSVREDRVTSNGKNQIFTILTVAYRFYAEDGSYITACVQGEGADTGDKSTSKCFSIAFKYACFQVLCIPTEEFVDPDADSPEESKPVKKGAPTPKSQPAGLPAEQPTEQTADALTCSECGNPIKKVKFADGTIKTPEEVATATGGKCIACYNTAKIAAATATA